MDEVDRPFFSVVVAVHNRGSELRATIDSVLTQDFAGWELIVVDDASTDSTPAVLASYDDRRMRCIRNDVNLERCRSRNLGVEQSTGRYVCFLDHDDRYLRNHLSSLKNAIESAGCPVAMFFTSAMCRFEGDEELHANPLPELGTTHPARYFFELVCQNARKTASPSSALGAPVTTSQSCFAREVITAVKWNESIVMIEDTELFMRAALDHRVQVVDGATVVYTYRAQQAWQSDFTRRLMEGRLLGLRQMARNPRLRPFMRRSCVRALQAHHHHALAVYHLGQGSGLRVLGNVGLSLALSPTHRTTEKLVVAVDALPGGQRVRRSVTAVVLRRPHAHVKRGR